jgi:hypothetical protein
MTQWKMLHTIVAAYEQGGEVAAAACLATVDIMAPGKSAPFADLLRRLFLASDQKWPKVAHLYNRISISWPEIERMAAELREAITEKAQG